jgi:hypothetical protein
MADTVITVLVLILLFIGLPVSLLRIIDRTRIGRPRHRDASRSPGFDAVLIATTDFGDAVYLRPGATEADTVYVAYHDGGDTDVFAESIGQMLAVLRQRRSQP